jgi:hypothetical protein
MLIKRPPTILRSNISSIRSASNIAQTKAAAQQAAGWKGTRTDGGETKHYIGGEWVEVGESGAEKWFDVKDPVSRQSSAHTGPLNSVFRILMTIIRIVMLETLNSPPNKSSPASLSRPALS